MPKKINKDYSIINEQIIEKSQIAKFIPVTLVNSLENEFKYQEYVQESNNEVKRTINSKSFSLGTSEVSTVATKDQFFQLNKDYNVDATAMLTNATIERMSQGIREQYIRAINELAGKNKEHYSLWDKVIAFFYTIFNKKYVKVYKIKSIKELQRKIMNESNRIFHRVMVAPPDFVICNLNTSLNLQASSDYVYYAKSEMQDTLSGIYTIGKLANLTIYVNPFMKWNDNTIIIGRKINKNDAGLHMFLYDKGTSIVTTQGLFKKILLKVNYALIDVGEHPEYNYLKFVYNSKKSLI